MDLPKKLICFDLDGTLTENTWELFNARLGISLEGDVRLFKEYVKGTLPYKEWILQLVRMYKENGVVSKNELAPFAWKQVQSLEEVNQYL
jgi:phosphoserine phosphatase